MENKRQTRADYVWGQYKSGDPRYCIEIQGIAMTPAYENKFVFGTCNNKLLFNAIM